MSNKLSAKEKLQKEIDDLLSKAFPQKEEEVKKSDGDFDENLDAKASSTDISVNANGGEDVIKNKDKKDEKAEKFEDKKEKEDDEEEKEEKSKMKKSEDQGEDKMKKSETVVEISSEDFEILKKAKAEAAEKARLEAEANDPLVKSINGLTDLIKSQQISIQKLTEEVDSLKKTPIRDRKSLIKGVDAVEKGDELKKSSNSEKKLSKSQVLDVMFDLQQQEKVSDVHICEYEATGVISDKMVKSLVQDELDRKFRK